ncbi:MAG: hypothetical protein A2X86_20855 [Bdellovibrionales bacterium GWA2_49_15]|nr:MAG: hypothetical protein A2X86_20855 [Bdellovibrionales bacterium GWA2_49_15]
MKIHILLCSLIFSFAFMACAEDLTSILANLNSSSSSVRLEAIRKLRGSQYRSRTQVLAPLLNTLRTDTAFLNREYAADILAQHADPRGRQSVIETFTDPQFVNSHEAAADSLKRVKSSAVKQAFMSSAEHANQSVRRIVAQGLGNFVSDPNVVTKLKEMVNADSYSLAREYAATSIANLPASQAVPLLAEILGNPQSKGRAEAAYGLRQTRSELAIPSLLTVLSDPNIDVRRNAIRGLENYKQRANVFEAFLNAVKTEPDSYAKSMLLDSILQSSDPRVLEIARAHIASNDHSVQRHAIEALKRAGDKSDLIGLIALLSDRDESVRSNAYDAIRAILNRLKRDDPFRTRLSQCLPRVSYVPYSNGTREAALLMDVLLGGFGMYSSAASGNRRMVGRLAPEAVTALQGVVRELLREEDPYAD